MKILIINTTDIIGGAANLAWQLGKELKSQGHKVNYLVGYKYTDSSDVAIINDNFLSKIIRKYSGNNTLRYLRFIRSFVFANDIDFGANDEIINNPWFKEADVIHLHNLHGGYFKLSAIKEIAKRKPTIWTLHDMWAITSHCGFCFECKRFNKGRHFTPGIFHYVPLLWDNSKYLWNKKHEIYQKSNFEIVSTSNWLKEMSVGTTMFGIKKINKIVNGIDTKLFKPSDKFMARQNIELPLNKKIILGMFSGSSGDKRKRFNIYKDVARIFENNNDFIFLCVGRLKERFVDKNIYYYPYEKNQKRTASFYSASDLLFMPSAMENCSLTVLEAGACGIPVLVFNNSGFSEIKGSNFLEEGTPIADIKNVILQLIDGKPKKINLDYSLKKMSHRYLDLYKKQINNFKFKK